MAYAGLPARGSGSAWVAACLLLALLALPTTIVGQAVGGDFALTRDVVAGGGTHMTSADFAVTATHAQPAVDMQRGGRFSLQGGFHQPVDKLIFADGFEDELRR